MHYNLEEAGHVLWDWIIKKGCGNDWLVKGRGGAKEGWSNELCRWLSLLHPAELIECGRVVVNETRGKTWWFKI